MSSVVREARAGDGTAVDVGLARRMLSYVLAHKGLFITAMILYPLNALSVVLPPFLVRQILDDAIPKHDLGRLKILAAFYLGAIVLEYSSGFAAQFAMSVLGQRAMLTLRARLFAHVQQLPAAFFDKNPIGRVLTRLTNDVEALGEMFATGAVTAVGDVLTLIAVVGMMLWLNVRLTLFAFLVVPPLVGLVLFFRRYSRRAFRAIRKHLARINAFLAEHIAGMSVVQIFRQEQRTQEEFNALNEDYNHANHQAILFDALLYAIVEAIGTCAVAAMIWSGSGNLAAGAIGAGTLVAFIQYIRRFFVPIRDLANKYTVMQSAFAASERIFTLLDEPVVITSPEGAAPIARLQRGIQMQNVWFSYRPVDVNDANADGWVLRGIDLRVRRGERVALVGATGAGKTTILKLINRSYDVQKGAVCIDDVDVRRYDLNDLRRLFAVVLQDVHLFSGRVMDNLAFDGRVDATAVRRAAEAVQVDRLIRSLPDGYDTFVRERGSNFSTGERQLLAFARALALDPEILVLDEATSNVDSETEARIQSALDVLLADRTALIVAHRLSTIRKVDRIVVLQDGCIVEEGDHEALLRQGGVYAALAQLQFGGGSTAAAAG